MSTKEIDTTWPRRIVLDDENIAHVVMVRDSGEEHFDSHTQCGVPIARRVWTYTSNFALIFRCCEVCHQRALKWFYDVWVKANWNG
jgi:hypothetical protein